MGQVYLTNATLPVGERRRCSFSSNFKLSFVYYHVMCALSYQSRIWGPGNGERRTRNMERENKEVGAKLRKGDRVSGISMDQSKVLRPSIFSPS